MQTPAGYFFRPQLLAPPATVLLCKLNRDFLDLLVAGGADSRALPPGVLEHLARAAPTLLDSIAACSFALFRLEFPAGLRAGAGIPEVHDPVSERYRPAVTDDDAWSAFATTVWFFAWHLSRNSPLSARLMLGLSTAQAELVATLEPWQLRHLAGGQPPLQPRWSGNPCFWPDLIRFADDHDPLRLRAARLLGLQLLAAELEPAAMCRN